MFDVQIDGKQTSLRLGVEREQMLLQCLMEIADAECDSCFRVRLRRPRWSTGRR
jgi:hypothetical protein